MKQKRPRRARGVIDFTKPNRAIIDAYESGLSYHGVAMKLGIKTSEVQIMIHKFSPGSIRQKDQATPLPRSKANTSPGKSGATKESPFVLTPSQLGHILAVDLLNRRSDLPAVLHALIYVAGVSRAEVAKVTGLTRGRIGHYLNLGEPVPEDRERQFYELLHGITRGYEKALAGEKESQEIREEDPDLGIGKPLVPAALPVVREIVKACRKALADYEAAQHQKDDANEGKVA